MYKVELTEKEVREVGVNRHGKIVWRRIVITFIVGFIAMLVGAYYWEFTAGKVWMILAGTVWVLYILYQSRRAGKAGLKFLEEIKGKGNIKA